MRFIAAIVAALSLAIAAPAAQAHHHHRHHRHPCGTTRRPVATWICAKRLSKSWYGWTGQEWVAENGIVRNESGWDSCAHWPSVHHDCTYDGTVLCANGICSNACGIPQATPCPTAWRGHLDLYRRQVFWFLHYIHDRYGDPENAYYHETHGGY